MKTGRRQQRIAATARRRTLLFQAPEPDVREAAPEAGDGQSPWEWADWVERHAEAERDRALFRVPTTYREAVTRYLDMKRQRDLFERRAGHGSKA